MENTANGPFRSLQERLVDEALAAALAPEAVLRGITRRPLFLPRFGYREDALTIRDVLGLGRYRVVDEQAFAYRANWDGNASGEINASARNTNGDVIGST